MLSFVCSVDVIVLVWINILLVMLGQVRWPPISEMAAQMAAAGDG